MNSNNIESLHKGLWERARTICISMMQGANEKGSAERCFAMISSVEISEDGITILTSNAFACETLAKQYDDDIKKAFVLAGADPDTKIAYKFDESSKPSIVIPKVHTQTQTASFSEVEATEKRSVFTSTMPLKEYNTFEEFVEGPSNSYVLASAKGAAAEPGKKGYNPLFIHGGTGLGKTHIMQAIGNEVKKRNPSASVCYLTAEVFLNEYVNALSNNNLHNFRERYRKIDVLLIDDIQFIAKNMQNFQEEFFNTFNALYDKEKQIVITSDVAPKNLPGIEARLISRFEGGMLQEIESPAYETRLAILKKKSEGMRPEMSENTLKFIAHHIKSHVRAIEGALSRVNIFSMHQPDVILTDDTLSYILKDYISNEISRKKLTIEEVQNCVCKKFAVTISQILSKERTQSIVTPRQLAMYISRKFTTRSLPEISKIFDKSHATIIHGVKNISKRLDVEPELKQMLEEILSELGCTMKDMTK